MESEGPYRHSRLSGRCVGGCMACIYAEGRKSAKKDLHYDELSLKYLLDRHESLVDDFKELLEFANSMSKWARYLSEKELVYKFNSWLRNRNLLDEKSERDAIELYHLMYD